MVTVVVGLHTAQAKVIDLKKIGTARSKCQWSLLIACVVWSPTTTVPISHTTALCLSTN